jgi:glycerol kinase
VVDAMICDGGEPLRELRADGGAAANNALMQFQADILDLPVIRPQLLETTAAGAAFLAGLGAGMWRSPDEIEGIWREDRRFVPKMDAAERERRYDGWRRAVERVRDDRRDPRS